MRLLCEGNSTEPFSASYPRQLSLPYDHSFSLASVCPPNGWQQAILNQSNLVAQLCNKRVINAFIVNFECNLRIVTLFGKRDENICGVEGMPHLDIRDLLAKIRKGCTTAYDF